ncbi:MAG: glycoside hydrolase family 16 protein [Bacteroidia bacterium]|nr:glycoside hydrolase family 16 protein [Bacteroidia bacterium]
MNYSKLRNRHQLISAGLFTYLLFTFVGCNDDGEIQKLPQRNYELVWSDEFDGLASVSPDATKWAFELGAGGWGNNEYEVYTNSTTNVSMDGMSNLAITATKVPTTPYATYYSGRIITKGLFTHTYGRFEARIKLPYGPGIWPAFWLIGANKDSLDASNKAIGWPQCGEIDIMELNGSKPNIINGTVHGPGYSGGTAITKSFGLANDRYDMDFHVFAIEWGKDYVDFFMDNTLYQQITPAKVTGKWVFNDHPFYILLNLAVGGNYVTCPTDQTIFPQTMLVDYVRVYKEVQ